MVLLLRLSVWLVASLALVSGALMFTLPKQPTQTPTLLTFFGDIMVGRHVETLMNANGDDYPFLKIQPYIDQGGFVMANLEGPIVTNHSQTQDGSLVFSFKDTTGALLAKHGLDAVTLANNHTLNQASAGFLSTEANLDAAGILHTGHPLDASDKYVLHTTINGLPMIIAGFNMTFPQDDPNQAIATVTELRKASDEPILVFMHWGTEYQLHSTAVQEDLAHKLINAGANAIIGAHPHVTEEVENYNGKMIFYSLGNFIFDQYFSTDTQQMLSVSLLIDSDGHWTWQLHPLSSVMSQPQVMDSTIAAKFLTAMQAKSPTVSIALDGTVK